MTEEMEELEVLPATKSPHGYLTSPLTDNIHMTDEGYLVIVGCPVARTGWQKYAVKNLPQARAKELGIDTSNPEASIDLYRPAKEVFHPEFLASLNGKPICDSHPPNGEFVDPKNFKKLTCGHLQNVRKGLEPLDDGEWPIIADLVISDHQLIEKVKNKTARDNSLGYDFSIDRDGDKIIQCSMSGNHDAIVTAGRAGDLVSIQDAAPEDPAFLATKAAEAKPSLPIPALVEVIETKAYTPIVLPPIPTKEKQTVADQKPKKDWLRIFKGKHLIEMARATDADPESVMDAAESLQEDVEDKRGAKDGELPEALKENEFKAKDKRRTKDRKSKDAEELNEAKDEEEEEEEMSDARRKAHDALDRALDAEDRKAHAKDADIEELKNLLDEFLDEEEKEPEHANDAEEADPSDLEAVLGAEDAEECPDCGEPVDDCSCPSAKDSESDPGEEEVESGEEEVEDDEEDDDDDEADVEDKKKAKAKDRARAADGANAVLRMLRPIVARTNDKAVQGAFNRALDSVKKSSHVSTGSYGAFAGSARARDKAPRNPNPDRVRATDGQADPIAKMQAAYNAAFKGGK
jgi:hypothetical protein